MDFSSPHLYYIFGAFAFATIILGLLFFVSLRSDRRISNELKKWKRDETKT